MMTLKSVCDRVRHDKRGGCGSMLVLQDAHCSTGRPIVKMGLSSFRESGLQESQVCDSLL